jgi:antitoxin component YwqK of YwqJK toxin-antitoxin module
MRPLKSDIPAGVTERTVKEFSEDKFGMGGIVHLEVRECIKDGKVVGERLYDGQGRLQIERPLKNRKKHGREIYFNDDGTILLIEPYADGKIHGTARQYDRKGRIVGTYAMVHGTGYDVWRNQNAGGPIYVSEIHSMADGIPHGVEWWLNEDQKSVHEEKHWYEGSYHGIEREWHRSGKLMRGYPKYWVHGEAVTKRQYVQAAQKDPTLPPFRLKDNSPWREFPPEIRRLLRPFKKK